MCLLQIQACVGGHSGAFVSAGKNPFPGNRDWFFGDWFEIAAIEREARASGAAATTRQAGRSIEWFLYRGVIGLQWQL